ncbi:MAG: MFS transporter, partial [Solirubrobacteraceae bacterium]
HALLRGPMIDKRLRSVALLVAACFFMEILDGTIVVTAVPQMSASLGVPPSSTALVITAYLLTLAVLIPLSGWMTVRFGPRRVFLSAIAIFTLASLGCALSTTLAELVALRIVQGAGGAMMVPVGRIVVLGQAEKSQIMRLMSFIVWPALIAPVIAPLAGGVITTYASWQWMFAINVPLGIVALAFAWRLITDTATGTPPPLDKLGVVLTCGALGAITYAGQVVSDGTPRWALAVVLVVAAAALSVAGAWHLLRTPAPLINLRTLRIPTFGAAISGSSMFWLVVGAIPFLLPLLFQTVFGWSAIKSGSVVLFVFVGNIAIKPATTWLFNRFGFRTMLLAATTGLAPTAIAAGLLTADTPVIVVVLIAVLSGVARSVGLTGYIGLTGYTTLGLSDVPPELMRDANALASTVQQLFSGLGVAAATVALRIGGQLHDLLPGRTDANSAFTVAFVLLGLAALVSAVDALRLHPSAGQALVEAPAR